MATSRSTCRGAPRLISRAAGPALRSALTGGLAIGMMVVVTAPGGADPLSEREQHTSITLSEPVIVRASGNAPTPGNGQEPDEEDTSSTADFEADLDVAREEEAEARASEADAQAKLDQAREAQSAALQTAEAAQDQMMQVRIRLGDLIAAEDAAVRELDRAVARVERTRAGSKARRTAFTNWQMAAVAERAGHARRSVAEDVGSHIFRRLRAAETTLADAELSLGEARSAHLKAVKAAEAASARVMELEAVALTNGMWSTDGPSVTDATTAPRAVRRAQP